MVPTLWVYLGCTYPPPQGVETYTAGGEFSAETAPLARLAIIRYTACRKLFLVVSHNGSIGVRESCLGSSPYLSNVSLISSYISFIVLSRRGMYVGRVVSVTNLQSLGSGGSSSRLQCLTTRTVASISYLRLMGISIARLLCSAASCICCSMFANLETTVLVHLVAHLYILCFLVGGISTSFVYLDNFLVVPACISKILESSIVIFRLFFLFFIYVFS